MQPGGSIERMFQITGQTAGIDPRLSITSTSIWPRHLQQPAQQQPAHHPLSRPTTQIRQAVSSNNRPNQQAAQMKP